jgi:RNA polymerase sigma-70 factor (ECF subfamily)
VHDDLAAALAADLNGSFERLVRTYQGRLFAFALRMTGDAQDAEEVTQDAFLRAYRALASYTPDRVRALLPRPWLYQITLNVARNQRRGRRLPIVSLDGSPTGEARDFPDHEHEQPDVTFERREHQDELARLVTALPARYRAAVILRHVEGLSYSELATVLAQPVGTVKSNVHRGIHLLRAALAEQMSLAER